MNPKEIAPDSDSEKNFSSNEALSQTVKFLANHWFHPGVGIVAASVVEDSTIISAASRYLPELHQWMHAEAAALEKFESLYGRQPNTESRMVVTLSPCARRSSSRFGLSCSDRIKQAGLTRIEFGFLDKHQTPEISGYKDLGLTAKLIEDPDMQKICSNLFALMYDLHSPDGKYSYYRSFENPWDELKKGIGLKPFEF